MERIALIVAIWFFTAVGQANADVILFDNGPMRSLNSSAPLGSGFQYTNAFTLSEGAVLTSATVGLWAHSPVGNTPTTVDWSIGTTPFGSDLGHGTAALSNVYYGPTYTNNGSGYVLNPSYNSFSSTFSLPDIAIDGGTYYLTLQNAVSSPNTGATVYWDLNYAHPLNEGVRGQNGSATPFQTAGSGTFELVGHAVPEPSTLTSFGLMAAIGMGFGTRRYLRIAIV